MVQKCIEWTGPRDRYGYGLAVGGGKVHRIAWTEIHGPIPPGMVIMHTCDNPPCINIDHLRLGTQRENLQDMWSKGRGKANNGEHNPKAKLTAADVLAIRERTDSPTAIAAEYGVSDCTIHDIQKRRTWRHV